MLVRMALLLAIAPLPLVAQGRQRPGPPPQRPFAGQPGGPRRERVVAQLHELRMTKLQQSLGVEPEKARTIADRWSRFDEETIPRRRLMADLREQMNGVLMGPGTEDEKNRKLQPMVERLATLRQNQQDARKRFEEDIAATLTPAQQSRFLLVEEDFQKAIREAIQAQRRGQN